MKTGRAATAVLRARRPEVVGGLAAVVIGAVVYSMFDIYDKFSRDSAIYVYGGQLVTHGVPPYAGIMDPKGPISQILCGFGVALARLFNRDDVLVVRAEFCALAILSVLGVYLLTLELCSSVVAAVVAAAVFATFKSYAYHALVGPEGHMPGITFLIFAMWLTVRRQWYWAGFAAALAFLVWQPLFAYPAIAFVCAVVWSPGRRLRAAVLSASGCLTPLVALTIYFAASGYPGKLFEGLFVFPLTAVRRKPMSLGDRVHFILSDIPRSYGASTIFFWAGLALLLGMAAATVVAARSKWRAALLSPTILLLVLSLVCQVAYMLYDYIGYPHTYPVLPYAAVGVGLGVAGLLARLPRARRLISAVLLVAVTGMTIAFAAVYYQPAPTDPTLRSEQASACAIQRSLAPGTPLWSLGDPIPLVLLHRRNPDNYPYEGSGLDVWKVEHTPGGFAGWTGQIKASGASVVVLDVWKGPYRSPMQKWLATHGYRQGFIGPWQVFVTRRARAEMALHSIKLAHKRQAWPLTTNGATFRTTRCSRVTAG